MRISRPSADRQRKFLHTNICEAGTLEQTFELRSRAYFLPLGSECLDEFDVEYPTGMPIFERTVGGFPAYVEVDQFGIAARFGISVAMNVGLAEV